MPDGFIFETKADAGQALYAIPVAAVAVKRDGTWAKPEAYPDADDTALLAAVRKIADQGVNPADFRIYVRSDKPFVAEDVLDTLIRTYDDKLCVVHGMHPINADAILAGGVG